MVAKKYKWNSDKKEILVKTVIRKNLSEWMIKNNNEKTKCSLRGDMAAVAKARPQKPLVSEWCSVGCNYNKIFLFHTFFECSEYISPLMSNRKASINYHIPKKINRFDCINYDLIAFIFGNMENSKKNFPCSSSVEFMKINDTFN